MVRNLERYTEWTRPRSIPARLERNPVVSGNPPGRFSLPDYPTVRSCGHTDKNENKLSHKAQEPIPQIKTDLL